MVIDLDKFNKAPAASRFTAADQICRAAISAGRFGRRD
jgi:hypothetical protein